MYRYRLWISNLIMFFRRLPLQQQHSIFNTCRCGVFNGTLYILSLLLIFIHFFHLRSTQTIPIMPNCPNGPFHFHLCRTFESMDAGAALSLHNLHCNLIQDSWYCSSTCKIQKNGADPISKRKRRPAKIPTIIDIIPSVSSEPKEEEDPKKKRGRQPKRSGRAYHWIIQYR